MINANRNASAEVLQQHKELSYERFRTQFAEAVEQKLIDFEMTWDDLAEKLQYKGTNGDYIKNMVRTGGLVSEVMNDLAHIFSCEVYVILRPRKPWIQT